MLNNFESKLLVEKTIVEEGYDPTTIKPKSDKFIWAACRVCGEPVRKQMIKYTLSNNTVIHDGECRKKERSVCNPFRSEEIKAKIKKTNLEKYGTEWQTQSSNFKEKAKQTNLERYGVENVANSEEIRNKKIETCLEKYGTEHHFQSDIVKQKLIDTLSKKTEEEKEIAKEKRKQTNLERLGVENPSQNSEIKEKRIQKYIEKYGVNNPSKVEEFKEKRTQTIIDRYGVDSPLRSEELKEKAKQTNLERYGVENVFQNYEIKKKIVEKNIEKYGVEHHNQNKEIKEKTIINNLKKYGVEYPASLNEIREKIKNTCIKKYGFAIPTKNKDVSKKVSESLRKRSTDNNCQINILRSNEFWEDHKKLSVEELSKKYNIELSYLKGVLYTDEFDKKHKQNYSYPKVQKQREVYDEIKKYYKGQIDFNTRSIISPYEIDIYIPEFKIGIEYCGSFWHSELFCHNRLKKCRTKHINKYKLCRDNGIYLITLFDNWWENKRDKVISLVKCGLGVYDTVIFARKCQVNNNECQEFIQKYHFQGKGRAHIKYFNLVYNGEIIASMTAHVHHRQNIVGNPIVLDRFCVKAGYKIIGGSQKLFTKFIEWAKENGYDRIISWSDNCWARGGLYERLGFRLEKEYNEDYFYWHHDENKYYSKHSQMKSITNCPSDLTESEWCNMNGLWRLWDCGKKKWVYKL